MQTIALLGLGLFLVVGLVLILIGLSRSRRPTAIDERIEQFAKLDRPPTLEEIELSQPFSERVLVPFARRVARFLTRLTPKQSVEAVRHKLNLAGNPFGWGPAEFMGLRILLAVLLGGLGLVLVFMGRGFPLSRRILLAIVMVVLGYLMPALWLGRKIKSRQTSIVKSLPDALDLLTICVEAGLGFDAAMAQVADKWDDELSRAFTRVIQEIQLGKLRREALRDMSDNMEVPDVATFVAAIIQAEQLGVSLARVLRIQSDQMRVRRRQRAEELARAAPIKMLPAIAFLIFPAIFVVLLGPAVLTLMASNIFGLNLGL
jgi:tight adherence protein C